MALTFSVPDTELSLTLHNRRNQVIDNIFQGAPFLNALSMTGGTRMEAGGLELVTPLLFSKNTTAGSFLDFDVLDTTPQDNETSARYPWAGLYATISISWMEDKRNSGPGQLINLVNQKTTDAMMSIRDQLNLQLIATQPSAASKDVGSVTEIIDNAPGTQPPRAANIGNINQADNSFWRPVFTTGGAFTVADMNTMFNDVSQGVEPPHLIATNDTQYERYENALVGQVRFASTQSGDLGFMNLLFKQTPVMFDPRMGVTDEMYFINTDYTKLVTHTEGDFITTDFVEPDNQAAKTAKILWMGQLECTNRRRNGVLLGITAPA
jgi:hypothetical protein